jgi:hypothetical protein
VSESQYEDQDVPGQQVPGPHPDAGPEPDAVESADALDADGEQDGSPDLSAAAPAAPVEHTGNPVVDSVLDSLQELDRLPPAEHVAVFEAAHERLRGALSDAGDPPAES